MILKEQMEPSSVQNSGRNPGKRMENETNYNTGVIHLSTTGKFQTFESNAAKSFNI